MSKYVLTCCVIREVGLIPCSFKLVKRSVLFSSANKKDCELFLTGLIHGSFMFLHVHMIFICSFRIQMDSHLPWAAHRRSFRTRSHHRSRDHLPGAGNVPSNPINANNTCATTRTLEHCKTSMQDHTVLPVLTKA